MTRSLPAAPPLGERSRRLGASDALLVFLGAQLFSFLWAMAVLEVLYGLDELPDPIPIKGGVLATVGLWIGYGLGATAISRLRGDGPVADFRLGLRVSDVPLGLAIGVATQLLLMPALYWPILRFVDGDPSEAAEELVSTVETGLDWGVFVVSVVFVGTFVEEYFYRGLMLRGLQSSWGTAVAIVVSSAIFAIVHQNVLLLPGLFLFAVIVALLAVRSDRLGLAWMAHMGFNAATVVVLAVGA